MRVGSLYLSGGSGSWDPHVTADPTLTQFRTLHSPSHVQLGGAACLQRWAPLFPAFAEAIQIKFNMPQYGGLAINGCRLIGLTCTPGTGPMTDEELVERWPEAELI
jgi:hypothetical protein